ncbi:MAG: 23S rRNA (adenine(2503)-C(2))-methyltransferase RlmN [Phycisphaerae bacterium]|nr:23S rRNA (adenine(2503)-C(2))-methyltransferase RlmN [Phycisphaerae bacterium]
MGDPAEKPPLRSPLGMTPEQVRSAAAGRIIFNRQGGEAGALAAYRALFRTGDASGLRQAFGAFPLPEIRTVQREAGPEGEVVKFTLRVPGVTLGMGEPARRIEDLRTESVLIPMIGKRRERTYTLCVSSQIGCAMGCTFCETAQMGLLRNLTADEIVAQWFGAAFGLGLRPANIVFMGMGEPMDNLDNVLDAVAVLKDHNGPSVPVSKITISTVGRVDGIRRLGERLHEPGWRRLGLAVSLNAPNDEVRSRIMPVNRRWSLAELRAALLDFPMYGGSKLCVEYVLIPGVNDAPSHAREIADFVTPLDEHYARSTRRASPRCVVNLIPYNPRRDSPWPAPDEARVAEFLRRLTELGVYAKRRRTKGRELMGACGQLGSAHIRGRSLVPLAVAGLVRDR